MLPTAPGRPVHIDAQVLGVDFNIDFLGFGKNGNRDGRRVNPPLGLRLRHPLDTMNPAFMLQAAVYPVPLDEEGDFLKPSYPRYILSENLRFPFF